MAMKMRAVVLAGVLLLATGALADDAPRSVVSVVSDHLFRVHACNSAKLQPGSVAISSYGNSIFYLDTECKVSHVINLDGPNRVFTPNMDSLGGYGLVYKRPVVYGPRGRLTFDGGVIRQKVNGGFSHELIRTAWGTFMSITRESNGEFFDDVIVEFNRKNQILRTLSLNTLIFNNKWGAIGIGGPHTPENWLHTNSLDTLADGTLIVSTRNISEVQVINWFTGKKIRSFGKGFLSLQHYARFQPNGTILVFNNGVDVHKSGIARFDIKGTLLDYKPLPFYAAAFGSVQKLANGNWLVVNGPSGRIYEFSPDLSQVYMDVEYCGKDYVGFKDDYKSIVYRATKVNFR